MAKSKEPEDHYVPARMVEFTTALSEMLNKIREELYDMEKRMADSRRNIKRGKSFFWDVKRRRFKEQYTNDFQLAEGVYWNPMWGIMVIKAQAHKQVLQMFRAYYGDLVRFV